MVRFTPCDDAVMLRRLLPGDTLRRLPGGVPLPARPNSMLRLLTLPLPASASTAAGKALLEAPGSEAKHNTWQTNMAGTNCGPVDAMVRVKFYKTSVRSLGDRAMVQSSVARLRPLGKGQCRNSPDALCCSLTGSSFPFWYSISSSASSSDGRSVADVSSNAAHRTGSDQAYSHAV